MHFIHSSRTGCSKIIITWKSYRTYPFPSEGNVLSLWTFCKCNSLLQFIFSLNFPTRLIVTDGAQCGAWNSWAATNKRSRNAKINHSENPSNSDAVQFFMHVVSNPPYNIFNMPDSLYQHFQNLLSTPDKPIQLTAQNFASKVSPQRKYPECVVNTGALFDEDGDPIFTMQVTSTPVSPALVSWDKTKGF